MTFLSLMLAVAAAQSAPELITIRSDRLEAAVSPQHGAELSSFRVLFRGRWIETLYLARDYSPRSGWTGKAPHLWPATGRNFAPGVKADGNSDHGSYMHKGRRYEMPIHGFVRNMPWKLVSRTPASAVFALEDTAETRRFYPFGFRLTVEYALQENALEIRYTVLAKDPLFFSIGNHITFRTPLVEGSDPAAITFATPSVVEYLKKDNVPTGETRPRSFAPPVKLGALRAIPAISLAGYTVDPWMRLTDPAGLSLHLKHRAQSWPDPPSLQFNVWGDTREGYFSPEPWVGIQNSLNLRKGLIHLAAGSTWKWTIILTASDGER